MAMDLLGFLARGLGGDFASRMSGLTGPSWRRWWPWLLLALAAIGLLAILGGCTRTGTTDASKASAAAPAAAPRPAPGKLKLYFDEGSAAPSGDAARQLGGFIVYAKANPGARVSVSGYNEPSGDASANEELARNRALAIRNVLVGQGVSEDAVDMNKPLATTGVSQGRESWRVEVSIE